MAMQLLKTPAYSVRNAVRTAYTYTQNQTNLPYSVGYALPLFTGFHYNNTSITKIDNQTVLLPAGSVYIVSIVLVIRSINGTGYRYIIVKPYLNGSVYDSSTASNTLFSDIGGTNNTPFMKTYTIDCTDGVSRQLQFCCVGSSSGVSTFALDNYSSVHFTQLT